MMKRFVMIIISLVSMLPCAAHVSAQAEDPSLNDVGVYSADARTARISALKEKYKITLDDKEKILVSTRCESAQEGLKGVSTRLSAIKRERETSYSSTINVLIRLKSLLRAKLIDTSSLDLLIVSYQQNKAMFDTALATYELTLEDATLLNCKGAPEDFRAALEGVRSSRKSVVDASSQIKEITKSNLKTTFDAIRLKLQTEGASNGK